MTVPLFRRLALSALLGSALMLAQVGGLSSAADDDPPVYDVGSRTVTGDYWNFDTDAHIGQTPIQAVTITNLPCFGGPNNPRAGSAQAGAIIFYGQMQAIDSQANISIYEGDVLQVQGGNGGGGHVRILTPLRDHPLTHIDATLFDLDQFAQDNTFRVCLQGY